MRRLVSLLCAAFLLILVCGASSASASCDLSATTGTFASQLSAATSGQTVCLAAGTYTLPAASKTNVTVQPQTGVAVTFSGTLLNLSKAVSGVTFDGSTGAGGLMDWGDLELCAPSHDLTWRHVRWDPDTIVIRARGGAGQCGSSGDMVGANLLFDGDRFLNYSPCASCDEARIHLPGPVPSAGLGLTIQNSLFDGGDGDGIQTGAAGVQILNNTFSNLVYAGAAHTDAIQPWGAKNTTIQGNLFVNDSTGVANYDGGNADNLIADNVFAGVDGVAGWAVINLGGSTRETVIHNTIVGSGKAINFGSKAGQQETAVTVRDNITPDGVQSSGAGSAATYTARDYQMCTSATFCTGTHSFTGSPTFVGGATPSTYAGFQLTAGSAGHAAASDGLDVGARITVADTTPPDTSITSAPSNSTSTSASVSFTGTDNVAVDHYECRIDAGSWSTCTSPKSYTSLSVASHTVDVRAYDAAGNVDATPASATWSVLYPPFVTDTFSGTSVALTSHTGETGATWTAGTGNTGQVYMSTSGGVREISTTGSGIYYASGTPGSANYTVEGDFLTRANYASDTTIYAHVLARMDTSASNYYGCRYGKFSGRWEIVEANSGTVTVDAFASATLASSTTYHVALTVNGSSLSCSVNGVTTVTATDSTITAAGKAGIRLQNNPQGVDDGIHIDNFTATQV